MAADKIPVRSEVAVENTWNLADIFPSDEAWFEEYEALKTLPEQIDAYRGRLGESAATLLRFFKESVILPQAIGSSSNP